MSPIATLALMSGLLNILLALWVWSLVRRMWDARRIIDFQRKALKRIRP